MDDLPPRNIPGEKLVQPEPRSGMPIGIRLACLPSGVGAVGYPNTRQPPFTLSDTLDGN